MRVALYIGLLLCAVTFATLGTTRLDLPGLYYDELLFLPVTFRILGACDLEAPVSWAYGCWPLYQQPPYLGVLKSYLYAPILAVAPVTPEVLRLPMLAILAATIIAVHAYWRRRFGSVGALALAALLACDPVVIFHARLDWGPFVLSLAARAAAVCAMIDLLERNNARSAVILCVALVLGFYEKLNFLWTIGALAIAAVVVYPGAVRRILTRPSPGMAKSFSVAAALLGVMAWLFLRPALQLDLQTEPVSFVDHAIQIYRVLLSTLSGEAQYTWMFSRPLEAWTVTAFLIPLQLVGGTILAGAILARLRRADPDPDQRVFAFLHVVLLATLAFIAATKEAGGSHHLVAVIPVLPMHLVSGARAMCRLVGPARSRRFTMGLALAAGMFVVLVQFVSVGSAYLSALDRQQTFRANHAPEIYSLADAVNALPAKGVVSTDWGLHFPLVALAPPAERGRFLDRWPRFKDAAPATAGALARQLLREVGGPLILVGHAPDRATFARAGDAFAEAVRDLAGCLDHDQTIVDSGQRPLYRFVRIDAGCAAEIAASAGHAACRLARRAHCFGSFGSGIARSPTRTGKARTSKNSILPPT